MIFKIIVIFLLIIHGLFHLMSFSKDYYSSMNLRSFFKGTGIFWLLSFLIFTVSIILLLMKDQFWQLPTLIAILLSQILILTNWKEAKFGTVINILLLLVILPGIIN